MKTLIKQLPNGLNIFLKESHASPVVAFQIWVGVGSADETPKESGLAHVLEHMLFKGTKKRGVGEIAKDVERAGGYVNAWTSHDETVFHVTMANSFAEQGLDVLCDAVRNSSIDETELTKELQVILEEIRMGKDSPDKVTTELLFSKMFKKHPYGKSVIGSVETVKSFNRNIVMKFYKKWYVPSNIALVVVGDFNSDEMFEWIKSRMGQKWNNIQKEKAIFQRPTRIAEPEQRTIRQAHRVMPIGEANVTYGFRIPGLEHDDVPALDLMAAILGQGASSRLETKIKRKYELATDIRAISFTPKDMGFFGVFASAKPHQLSKLSQAVAEQLKLLTIQPILPKEIEKARSMLLSDLVYSEETVGGMAQRIGYYGLHAKSKDSEKKYLAGLAIANVQQLSEVAKKYFSETKVTIAITVPDPSHREYERPVSFVNTKNKATVLNGKTLKQELVNSFSKGFKTSFKKSNSTSQNTIVQKLDSGDTIIIKPDFTSQIVSARAAFFGGLRNEPLSQSGLCMLLSTGLTLGTTNRNASDIAHEMDALACSISGFTGRNTLGIQGEFLASNFVQGFNLMSECLKKPTFTEDEIGVERSMQLGEINNNRDSPEFQVFSRFQKALFTNHPYSRSILGNKESVENLSVSKIRAFHKKATSAGKMVLAVVGGVDPDEVIELSNRYFASEIKKIHPLIEPKMWVPRKEAFQVVYELPKQQSHVVIGFPGTTLDSKDRFAVEVLIEILGGHGGRLFEEVREKRSLAYAVTALSIEGIEPGYIALYSATASGQENKVVNAMLEQIDRIKNTRPSSKEMARVKRHIIGTRAIARQRSSSRAAGVSLGYLYGLGHDLDERFLKEISKVSANNIVDIARKFMNYDQMVISCVGNGVKKLKLV